MFECLLNPNPQKSKSTENLFPIQGEQTYLNLNLNFGLLFTAILSWHHSKKKSPQMVDKVEDLQYTERMRKKDFYINVKKSLLNL